MKLVPWTTVLKIKFSASVSYRGYHVAIEIGKSVYYAPAPNRRCIKWWCCLSVCLSFAYIGTKTRTERPRKTKLDTEVAHVTCDSDTTFKVKRSKVKVTRPLCSPPLAGQAAAAVGVWTCWPWETATMLPSARRRKAPTGERGGAYRGGRPPAACYYYYSKIRPNVCRLLNFHPNTSTTFWVILNTIRHTHRQTNKQTFYRQ